MVAGHLQEKKGNYYIVLCYSVAGKNKSKWISTGLPVKGNKKKAEEMLYEARKTFVQPEDPLDIASSDMLFTDFMKMWLAVAKSTIETTTYSSYSAMTNKIIIPHFALSNLTVKQIQPHHIQAFYLKQLERVSANSVLHYHAVLHRALKYAVKTKLIPYNPSDLVDKPKKVKFNGDYYNEKELYALFEAVRGTKLELPVVLASFYGLRRSEIVGLKWDAFDFEKNTLSVKHTLTSCTIDGKRVLVKSDSTKNESSKRTLPLIEQFRDMLLSRSEYQNECRRVCGNCYNNEYLDYVCVDEMGNLIKPNYITQTFSRILEKNELRHIRFHDLRHTCASLLIKNGIPLKNVQEWLGHSDYATTANIYAHLDFTEKLDSAQAMLGGIGTALAVVE